MEHTLIVAGIGPGDPDYILPKAQKAIEGRTTSWAVAARFLTMRSLLRKHIR